jgi:hypothetical protein
MLDATFTTPDGKRHALEVTAGIARRVRRDLGINLADANLGRTFAQLASDRGVLIDVLWAVAEGSSSEPLDRDEFEDSLDGASIDAAGGALVAAIVGFSPSPQRAALWTAWERIQQTQTEAGEKLAEKIRALDVTNEIDEAVESAVKRVAKAPRRTPSASATS